MKKSQTTKPVQIDMFAHYVTVRSWQEGDHWVASIGDWWVAHSATKESACKQVIKLYEQELDRHFQQRPL